MVDDVSPPTELPRVIADTQAQHVAGHVGVGCPELPAQLPVDAEAVTFEMCERAAQRARSALPPLASDIGQQAGTFQTSTIEILGVCEDRCDAGTFVLSARPRNAGNVEAPAGLSVTLRAGPGGDIAATLVTSQPRCLGQDGEVLLFEVAAVDLAEIQPMVTIDDTGLLFECDEDNNTATWPLAACSAVEPD